MLCRGHCLDTTACQHKDTTHVSCTCKWHGGASGAQCVDANITPDSDGPDASDQGDRGDGAASSSVSSAVRVLVAALVRQLRVAKNDGARAVVPAMLEDACNDVGASSVPPVGSTPNPLLVLPVWVSQSVRRAASLLERVAKLPAACGVEAVAILVHNGQRATMGNMRRGEQGAHFTYVRFYPDRMVFRDTLATLPPATVTEARQWWHACAHKYGWQTREPMVVREPAPLQSATECSTFAPAVLVHDISGDGAVCWDVKRTYTFDDMAIAWLTATLRGVRDPLPFLEDPAPQARAFWDAVPRPGRMSRADLAAMRGASSRAARADPAGLTAGAVRGDATRGAPSGRRGRRPRAGPPSEPPDDTRVSDADSDDDVDPLDPDAAEYVFTVLAPDAFQAVVMRLRRALTETWRTHYTEPDGMAESLQRAIDGVVQEAGGRVRRFPHDVADGARADMQPAQATHTAAPALIGKAIRAALHGRPAAAVEALMSIAVTAAEAVAAACEKLRATVAPVRGAAAAATPLARGDTVAHPHDVPLPPSQPGDLPYDAPQPPSQSSGPGRSTSGAAPRPPSPHRARGANIPGGGPHPLPPPTGPLQFCAPRWFRRAVRSAAIKLRRDASGGPSGLPPGIVAAALRDDATLHAFCGLMWALRHDPPLWLCSARAVVFARMKVSAGTEQRKVRALCVGEAMWRVVESAYLRHFGRHVWQQCGQSISNVPGGAATAGAVLAGLARHGRIVASVDVHGAFDETRHADVAAALRSAQVPREFAEFVMASLSHRSVRHRGRRLDLTPGLGLGQGGSLAPVLFAAVAQGVARACTLADGVTLVFYADNYYVIGVDPAAVHAAVCSLVAALRARALVVGDTFVCVPEEAYAAACALGAAPPAPPADAAAPPAWDCGAGVRVPIVTPASAVAVFLGIPASAAGARARIAALTAEVELTRDLPLQTAVIILRGCVLPALGWLALCPDVAADVARLHGLMVDNIAARAAMPGERWAVVQLAAAGGLGLTPPAVAAVAASRNIVLNALGSEWPLRRAAWGLAGLALELPADSDPTDDFVGAVLAVHRAGAVVFDRVRSIVRWATGEVLVRAPPERRCAALATWSAAARRAAEPPQYFGAVPRADGPLAALLCVDGAVVPELDDASFIAAAHMHAALDLVAPDGTGTCPFCGADLGPQHHAHCPATIGPAKSAVHRALERHVCALFVRAGVSADSEVGFVGDDGADLVIDLRLAGVMTIELKTLALLAPSRARTTLVDLERGLEPDAAKYGPGTRLLVLSRDGRVTVRGLKVIADMQALLDSEADPDGPPRPTVMAALGAAVAEAEASCRALWQERVAAHIGAAAHAAPGADTDAA